MSEVPTKQRQLSIAYQAASELKPRSSNPRLHSKKQLAQIANAIRRFGFTNPVLIDGEIETEVHAVSQSSSISRRASPECRVARDRPARQ